MALRETNLKSEDYKNICRFIFQYLKHVNDNWRTAVRVHGSYKLRTCLARCFLNPLFPIGDDFISDYDEKSGETRVFDRESVELKLKFINIYKY
jgi:hypothetical protein